MNNKMFLIRVLMVAVGVLGIVMLISGMVLRRLDEASRTAADNVPMPEEYIEEFFSGEDSTPNIEDYIEEEG